jgi:hypothetical protein
MLNRFDNSNLFDDLHNLTDFQTEEYPPFETECANIPLRIFAYYINHARASSYTPIVYNVNQPTPDCLPNIHNLPTHHLIDSLNLSDRLQMTKQVETSILYHLQLRSITDPWTVFIVGCSRRDMVSARRAICHFGTGQHIPANRLHDIKPWEVAGLPMEYLLELMRLRLKGGQIELQKGVAGQVLEGHVLGCWAHVAREFGKKSLIEPPKENAAGTDKKGSESAAIWPVMKNSGFTVGRGGNPKVKKARGTRRERDTVGGKAHIGK